MIEDDTIKLLRECDAGIKMGVESINTVLPYVADEKLKKCLTESREKHEKLKEEIQILLAKAHDDGKNPNPIAQGMSWIKTNVRLMMKESDQEIAVLMTDGCNMGIKSLNKYLNQYQAADAKPKKITEELIHLEEKLADTQKPRVYLAGNSNLLTTAGSKMYQSGMVTLAGAENVAADIEDTYWAEVSYEQLLKWNPDVIVLASDASYSVEDVLADENLADCTAVKNGAGYQLPGDAEAWDSPVPSGILGSVWLASVLHGDVMGEECEDIIHDFYQRFYGFSYGEN